LDRMELVSLDGYTEDDKIVIARSSCCHGSSSARRSLRMRSRSPMRRCGRSPRTTRASPAYANSSASSRSCCVRQPPSSRARPFSRVW
jgi:hypothetical protein